MDIMIYDIEPAKRKNHVKAHRVTMERSKRYAVLGLTAGIACGFLLCLWTKPILPCLTSNCCLKQQLREQIRHEMDTEISQQQAQPRLTQHKQVLIGVMTAAQFVDNRAKAVWKTWAQQINGDVIFFSSEGSESEDVELPLVSLPGVTDAYPPQKKSFMMMKYLHDYGADKYRFFMRVDDDVYIHPARLRKFLDTLNHTKALYLGQAGIGNAEELGQLSLNPDENFCMGGPGIVFSAETLRRTVPHISYCLQHLLTSHEDVELGRCIRMFAGVSCSWNYEMQKIFHHSYAYKTDKHVFPYQLDGPEMHRAITLHPVKDPQVMFEVHKRMNILEQEHMSARRLELMDEINQLEDDLGHQSDAISDIIVTGANSVKDIIPWKFLTVKHQYSHDMFSVKRNHDGSRKKLLQQALNFVIQHYNTDAYYKGRIIERPEIVYGYHRNHPTKGTQLLLYLKMIYTRTKGKYMKTAVYKQVMLEKAYSPPEIRAVDSFTHKLVHLILPVSGKIDEFKRFLAQFSQVCGETKLCKLIIILYPSQHSEETLNLIKESQYNNLIHVLEGSGEFSRAKSLHEGVKYLSDDDLVLFIDVDIYYTAAAIHRVQQHTILGQQAYFPIVFSQYDSQIVCGAASCPVKNQSEDAGSFRYFGFGIASMYKADYLKCGGFDLSIHGWGKEDVDLYSKILKSDIDVVRAADTDITHIYHEKICDDSLNSDQVVMCVNSKTSSLASQRMLANLYYQKRSKL